MRTDLYKRIQRECVGLVNRYTISGRFPKPHGKYVDCGARKYLVWEHRDYNDPFNVEPVCHSCNALRGEAKAEILNVETLEWVSA